MNGFAKYLNPVDIILLLSITGIMGILFSFAPGIAEEILKVSPSEIFDGLPENSPGPIPSPPPTPSTTESPGKPDITSRTASLHEIAPIPTPKKTPIVFDNAALEQYKREISGNPAESSPEKAVPAPNAFQSPFSILEEPPSETPVPKPDIEELRQKLHETPSPNPISNILILPLSIDIQGMDSRWGEPGVTLILDYQCSNLFASLCIAPFGREKESITILKNAKSRERCLVDEGEYAVTGKFWVPNIKQDQEITVSFGTHALKNYSTYILTFDRALEQELKDEIDYRAQERVKAEARERKDRSP